MEIKVNLTPEILQNAVEKVVLESLEKSYSNPVKDAVDAELKEQDGTIRTLVKQVITSALTDEKYQANLKDAVLQKLVGKIIDQK